MPEKKILIVDDEYEIANLTALWMEAAGYRAVTAYDGKSGLATAVAQRPHVILLDIRMPDWDGFEVHRRLREVPELSNTPVIFLSAHAQEQTRQEVTALGACFLSKPFECPDLIAAVAAASAAISPSSLSIVEETGSKIMTI